jgi:hypothetical protein
MSTDTLITIGVSFVTSALTAFAIVAYRMGRYSEKIDQLEKCNLNQRLSKLEGQFEQSAPLTRRKSPVSLSDRGMKVLLDSGGKAFVDENFEHLHKTIEAKKPETAYDVQEIAKSVIASLKDDSRINPMKDYLFKEGMTIDDLFVVLGVYLRDKVLQAKGWNSEDIDKHDPGSKE